MPRGPKAVVLELSEREPSAVLRLLRRHGTGQALAQHATHWSTRAMARHSGTSQS